jgi:hypothetical protein
MKVGPSDDVTGVKAARGVAMWILLDGGSISPRGYSSTVSPTVGLIRHQDGFKYGTGSGAQVLCCMDWVAMANWDLSQTQWVFPGSAVDWGGFLRRV